MRQARCVTGKWCHNGCDGYGLIHGPGHKARWCRNLLHGHSYKWFFHRFRDQSVWDDDGCGCQDINPWFNKGLS